MIVEALRELDIQNALLVVTSWERALELRDMYGCKLVEPVGSGRWTADQLGTLLSLLPHKKSSEETLEHLMQMATLAGAPGILTISIDEDHYHDSGKRTNERRAQLMDAEWRNGISVLNGEKEITEENAGRFPNKNGSFHWY